MSFWLQKEIRSIHRCHLTDGLNSVSRKERKFNLVSNREQKLWRAKEGTTHYEWQTESFLIINSQFLSSSLWKRYVYPLICLLALSFTLLQKRFVGTLQFFPETDQNFTRYYKWNVVTVASDPLLENFFRGGSPPHPPLKMSAIFRGRLVASPAPKKSISRADEAMNCPKYDGICRGGS
jgi:hypothetical protein